MNDILVVPLSNGFFSIIDPEDGPIAFQYKWKATGKPRYQYAGRSNRRKDRESATMMLHRIIMKAPKDKQVDHINHDVLDNRKCNLRLVTGSQNMQNKITRKKTLSGIRNVRRVLYPRSDGRVSVRYQVILKIRGLVHSFEVYTDINEAEDVAISARKRLMTHAPECE